MHRVPHGLSVDVCPLLTAVLNDRLWVMPTSVYCRRPDGRVRMPGRTTLIRLCTAPSFRRCPDYQGRPAPTIGREARTRRPR
jgi:hypothetical protein